MIISFDVDNYLSFAQPAHVDLAVGAQAPDNYHFLPHGNDRTAKIVGLFGPNASGKSNLLRALPALADFITESFGYKLDENLPFRPHFFSDEREVTINIEFMLPDDPRPYRYSLRATQRRVLSESLRVKTSKFFSRVFERTLQDGVYRVLGLGEKFQANLRDNVSWLAWLAQYNVPDAVSIIQYFKRLQSNLQPRGPRVPILFSSMDAVDFYRSRPDFTTRMVNQLNRWDIDIHDVVFERMEAGGVEEGFSSPWMAFCVHKKGDKSARLPIFSESSGTLGLFCLLSIVLPVLESGGVAVIDELESDLHPHMVEALLNLFVMPESNPKNAQLIFTSHADWLMNLLHKTQIILVEKNESGSEAVRLSDIRGIEARENFSARYRAGAYGAVPEIN